MPTAPWVDFGVPSDEEGFRLIACGEFHWQHVEKTDQSE